ncbi:YSC84-related protein [Cupriavidus sp. 2TAF22]|uniref:BPSL1445 family SYLF domain-containing lipoprotein n=1 Tax=unclassified Cupriavidus TaxID=2640874 RepID=UPI003F8E5648
MLRRNFILIATGSVAAIGITLPGCTTTGTASGGSQAADRRTIDTGIDSTLTRLYSAANGSHELVGKSRGVLVFPSVIAAGFWFGGQYGEGALRVGGSTVGYYSTATASFGPQIGAQSKALVFLFMTPDSLERFTSSEGWAVGGDASVAVLKVGANGNIDSNTATAPVTAFVLTNSGLMAGVTLEGTKVTRLKTV